MVPPWAVESPDRAAGFPSIITVEDPMMMVSGGPEHVHMSPVRAAGRPPIKTVGAPGGIIGPPTWGTVAVTRGQTCISPTLAAIDIDLRCYNDTFFLQTLKNNSMTYKIPIFKSKHQIISKFKI
jgi:hypothetical protein